MRSAKCFLQHDKKRTDREKVHENDEVFFPANIYSKSVNDQWKIKFLAHCFLLIYFKFIYYLFFLSWGCRCFNSDVFFLCFFPFHLLSLPICVGFNTYSFKVVDGEILATAFLFFFYFYFCFCFCFCFRFRRHIRFSGKLTIMWRGKRKKFFFTFMMKFLFVSSIHSFSFFFFAQ